MKSGYEVLHRCFDTIFNAAVFEWVNGTTFHPATPLPLWISSLFIPSCDNPETYTIGEDAEFVRYFVEDAVAYWQAPKDEPLESGLWEENDENGNRHFFEMRAYVIEGKPLLYINNSDRLANEMQRILQISRERDLSTISLKNKQHALRINNEHVTNTLNSIQQGTVLIDAHGVIVHVNKRIQDLTGKKASTLIGQTWEELFQFQEDDTKKIVTAMEQPSSDRIALAAKNRSERLLRLEIEVITKIDSRGSRIFLINDRTDVELLRVVVDEKSDFHGMIGQCPALLEVYDTIKNVAPLDWTVLVTGETGTGKELVARAIHEESPRCDQPFIAVNCAGIPDSLLASELFGHRRGAFTGALESRTGLFEAADGGTLFLDEIGDVSQQLQQSLLRAVEERVITRLGDSEGKKIDVRIVTATNRDLEKMVEAGDFRADLFYRLRALRIDLPPLRMRNEDVMQLATVFLHRAASVIKKTLTSFSNSATNYILNYDWPGNIRELKNAVEYMAFKSKGSEIVPQDLPPEITGQNNIMSFGTNERSSIAKALHSAKGNRSKAAQELGMSRATFYRKLQHYGFVAKTNTEMISIDDSISEE